MASTGANCQVGADRTAQGAGLPAGSAAMRTIGHSSGTGSKYCVDCVTCLWQQERLKLLAVEGPGPALHSLRRSYTSTRERRNHLNGIMMLMGIASHVAGVPWFYYMFGFSLAGFASGMSC